MTDEIEDDGFITVRGDKHTAAQDEGPYGKERCPCGRCKDWHLTGIGKFVQGSGFTEEEADRILSALRSQPGLPEILGQEAEAMAEVREALEKAESTFERYSKLHSDKLTKDGDQKAAINMALAMEMGEALVKLEGK